jgi:hypothetical protein
MTIKRVGTTCPHCHKEIWKDEIEWNLGEEEDE